MLKQFCRGKNTKYVGDGLMKDYQLRNYEF